MTDPATVGVLIAAAVGVGPAIVWVVNRIWGARGVQDTITKSVETLGLTMKADLNALGLTMKSEVQGVMTETRLQTLKLDTMAQNLSRVESNQAKHEASDETRFKDILAETKETRHKGSNTAQVVAVLEARLDGAEEEIDKLSDNRSYERRRTSPTPYPPTRDPRKDPSDR